MNFARSLHFLGFTAAICLLAMNGLQAQVPATLADVVVEMKVYSAMGDRRETTTLRWLQSSGTFVDFSRQVLRSGVDLGFAPSLTGTYTYQVESADTWADDGDPCVLLTVSPGAYTAIVSARDPGDALLEVYFLP